jgi:hypothetical protein
VALSAALRALADGSAEEANPAVYDALRMNEGGAIYDLLIRGGTVVGQAAGGSTRPEPFAADLAVNVERGRGDAADPRRATVQDVGDLSVYKGIEEVDARDYYVVFAAGELRVGAEAALFFYRKERAAGIDWAAPDIEARFPPEAVFRGGRWERRGNLPVK